MTLELYRKDMKNPKFCIKTLQNENEKIKGKSTGVITSSK